VNSPAYDAVCCFGNLRFKWFLDAISRAAIRSRRPACQSCVCYRGPPTQPIKAGDRLFDTTEKLAQEVRVAQDRIAQLEGDVAAYRDYAERAELWLDKIRAELEQHLSIRTSA
jgi:hypothetical protein